MGKTQEHIREITILGPKQNINNLCEKTKETIRELNIVCEQLNNTEGKSTLYMQKKRKKHNGH